MKRSIFIQAIGFAALVTISNDIPLSAQAPVVEIQRIDQNPMAVFSNLHLFAACRSGDQQVEDVICFETDFDADTDFAETSKDCFLNCDEQSVVVKSFCGPNIASITPSPLQFATGVCTNASSGGLILASSAGKDRHQGISEIQITDQANSFNTVTGVANPNLPDDGIYTKRTTITIIGIPPFPFDLVENESTLIARSGLTTIGATFDKMTGQYHVVGRIYGDNEAMGVECAGDPTFIDFYSFGGVNETFVSYELIQQGDNFDVFCNGSGDFRAETCIEPEQLPCNVNTTFSLSVSCDVLITDEFDNAAVVIPGDINGDGITNLQDVGPFTNLLSSGGYHPAADIDMDCDVDLVDLNLFVNLL